MPFAWQPNRVACFVWALEHRTPISCTNSGRYNNPKVRGTATASAWVNGTENDKVNKARTHRRSWSPTCAVAGTPHLIQQLALRGVPGNDDGVVPEQCCASGSARTPLCIERSRVPWRCKVVSRHVTAHTRHTRRTRHTSWRVNPVQRSRHCTLHCGSPASRWVNVTYTD